MARKRKQQAPNIEAAEAAIGGGGATNGANREHNAKARSEAIKNALERLYQIDREIAGLIESSGIADLRQEKSDIKKRLREDYSMPNRLVMARYAGYRIERQAEDGEDEITLDAIREMYEALPVGGMADLGDAAGWPRQEKPAPATAHGNGGDPKAKAYFQGHTAGMQGKAQSEAIKGLTDPTLIELAKQGHARAQEEIAHKMAEQNGGGTPPAAA